MNKVINQAITKIIRILCIQILRVLRPNSSFKQIKNNLNSFCIQTYCGITKHGSVSIIFIIFHSKLIFIECVFFRQIPEFWKLIEKNLSLDPDGIKNVKQVLTLLEYTTIQSVSKLAKRSEIPALELEFQRFKQLNPDVVKKYPNLANLKFSSGFQNILIDIATKVKRCYATINIDAVSDKVLSGIKVVRHSFLIICLIVYKV